METVIAIDPNGGELPEQVTQFVEDLNWLRDEGYIEYVKDKDGIIRVYPTEFASLEEKAPQK